MDTRHHADDHRATGLRRIRLVRFFCVGAASFVICLAVLMLTTGYRVVEGVLHLRMGPFSRRIPLDSVRSASEYGVKRGRTYGLGTDLLAIEYDGGSVCVTPKDMDGFAETLGVPVTRFDQVKPPV